MLKVIRLVMNPLQENCYILYDEETLEAAVIDPGMFEEDEKESVRQAIDANGLKVKYLFNTHCHLDHASGNKFIKDNYSPEFLAPENDLFLLRDLQGQGDRFGVDLCPSPEPDEFLAENKELFLGKMKLQFLFTPGHTPGEYCIYNQKYGILFSGDLIFRGAVGRTDLWGGDFRTLKNSIRTKIFTLPGDTAILPGHGDSTSVKKETEEFDY